MSNKMIFWGNLTPLYICHWSVETLRVCLAFLQLCILHLKNHNYMGELKDVAGLMLPLLCFSELSLPCLLAEPFSSLPCFSCSPFPFASAKERCSQPCPGSPFGTCSLWQWLSWALSALHLLTSPAPHLTCNLTAANTNLAINTYIISLG